MSFIIIITQCRDGSPYILSATISGVSPSKISYSEKSSVVLLTDSLNPTRLRISTAILDVVPLSNEYRNNGNLLK